MEEEKEKVVVQNSGGSKSKVELITYLISDDNTKSYIVYSKGEITGADQDEVIYISRIEKDGELLKLKGIADDEEWASVQVLLKKIANA